MLDIKKWIANVSERLQKYTHTNKTLTVQTGTIGISYASKYCNFFFPIPYIPESYSVTLKGCSIVNVGDAILANLYSKTENFIYVRVYNGGNGLVAGRTYQGSAIFEIKVGGVLLNSISKAFSHLQKIGGGLNAGHQKTNSKNTELDKSTVHNSLCNCLWKQSKLKYSYNSTDGKRLYVCMLDISKLKWMGRLRISGACRQSNNKAVVPFVQSERHENGTDRLGAICEDISVIASERRWAYA